MDDEWEWCIDVDVIGWYVWCIYGDVYIYVWLMIWYGWYDGGMNEWWLCVEYMYNDEWWLMFVMMIIWMMMIIMYDDDGICMSDDENGIYIMWCEWWMCEDVNVGVINDDDVGVWWLVYLECGD